MLDSALLRPIHDAEAFAAEQERLGQVWTLLGLASDVPRENDWFRTRLGGRSVFVQRFPEGLRGFENRCAHRGFPLRQAEHGHGPILCAFHHWRYDSEGRAVGIPNCQDGFGATPREMNRSLQPLDLACCGDLVFGRFPGAGPTLEAFLGPAFAVLAALCGEWRGALRGGLPVRANWRLLQWISLDEYHLAAVHPRSFGTKARYLPRRALNYTRFGPHSAYFIGEHSGSIEDWAASLARGGRDPVPYRILHLFPDTAILLPPGISAFGQHFRYLAVLRSIPLAHDRSEITIRIHRHRASAEVHTPLSRAFDLFEPVRLRLVRYLTLRVLREDRAICETLQAEARQIPPDPPLSAAETRIAWFNTAYAEAMGRADAAP